MIFFFFLSAHVREEGRKLKNFDFFLFLGGMPVREIEGIEKEDLYFLVYLRSTYHMELSHFICITTMTRVRLLENISSRQPIAHLTYDMTYTG